MISQLSKSIRQYMLVTFNYWNFTVTRWRTAYAGGALFS